MDAATLVKLGITLSIFLIVFSIGLSARLEMALGFLKAPGLAARAMLAMFVLVPAFVIALLLLFPQVPPVPATLLALAVSPMPPIIPKKELKAGGSSDYVISLQVVATVVSLLAAAIVIPVAGAIVGSDIEFAGGEMLLVLLKTVGLPLAAGIALNHLAPGIASRLAGPIGLIGTVVLLVAAVLMLIKFWPAMMAAIGDGKLWAIVAIVLFGLLIGHLLGGPDEGNRSALAVATAARHPAVAIALAVAMRPDAKPMIFATVLLYLLAALILSVPYLQWRKRKGG